MAKKIASKSSEIAVLQAVSAAKRQELVITTKKKIEG